MWELLAAEEVDPSGDRDSADEGRLALFRECGVVARLDALVAEDTDAEARRHAVDLAQRIKDTDPSAAAEFEASAARRVGDSLADQTAEFLESTRDRAEREATRSSVSGESPWGKSPGTYRSGDTYTETRERDGNPGGDRHPGRRRRQPGRRRSHPSDPRGAATWAATRDGPEVLVPIVDPRTTPTARTRTACRVDTSSVRVARARRRTVAARRGGTRTFARRCLPRFVIPAGAPTPTPRARARADASTRYVPIAAHRAASRATVEADGPLSWRPETASRRFARGFRSDPRPSPARRSRRPASTSATPSGPGPDGPGLVREQRAARGGLVDDPDRPTWRERASEYILAGGGDGGAGGRRRGPHERGLLRDGRVGLAGQTDMPIQGPNDMFGECPRRWTPRRCSRVGDEVKGDEVRQTETASDTRDGFDPGVDGFDPGVDGIDGFDWDGDEHARVDVYGYGDDRRGDALTDSTFPTGTSGGFERRFDAAETRRGDSSDAGRAEGLGLDTKNVGARGLRANARASHDTVAGSNPRGDVFGRVDGTRVVHPHACWRA